MPITGNAVNSIQGSGNQTVTAPLLTVAPDGSLLAERVLTAGTGISFDDAGPNSTFTVSLADSGVVPGSYTNSNITVDAKGRITSASSGAAGGGVTGTGTAGEIAFWIDTSAISSDGNLTWDSTTKTLFVGGIAGFGVTAPTAFVDVGAADSAMASLRIRSGIAPSIPNDGDMWYNGNDLIYHIGGLSPISVAIAGKNRSNIFSAMQIFTGAVRCEAGVSLFNAPLSLDNNVNISLGTAGGTKIGTAPEQKLAFYGATPITQPSSTGETRGFTQGPSDLLVSRASRFTGNVGTIAYTISDIVKHLKNLGLIAA